MDLPFREHGQPGKFVVFEGINGCGKSTQTDTLRDYTRSENIESIFTNEPWDGGFRRVIKSLMCEENRSKPTTIGLLMAADRIYHIESEIMPALTKGKSVFSDRYFQSSTAFQVSDGVSLEWIIDINRYAIQPDLCFLIDLPVEVALGRMSRSQKHKEEKEFWHIKDYMNKVRNNYLEQAEFFHWTQVIDGNKPKNEVFGDILRILREKEIIE